MSKLNKSGQQKPPVSGDAGMGKYNTLIRLFERAAAKFPNNSAFWEKSNTEYQAITYVKLRERICHFSGGLICKGIRPGDRVALLSQARTDWVTAELGILYSGAISVPLSVRLEPPEIRFRLEHSAARVLVVSEDQYPKVVDAIPHLESLELLILLDAKKTYTDKEMFVEELLGLGKTFIADDPERFQKIPGSVEAEDCALISYTSGTTADPKGIMLSHKNLVTNCEQCLEMFEVLPEFRTLLILPLDHSFAHTTGMYVFLASGASLAAVQTGKTPAATLRNVLTNIMEVRPVALLSVPTLAKNIRKNIERKITEKGLFVRTMFRYGLWFADRYFGDGTDTGKGGRILFYPIYRMFDRLVFTRIRENFGGRLRYFVGGGALLDADLQRFFLAIGLPMYQGYGLSEASPVISSNTVDSFRIGSSGKVVPRLEVRICDEVGNPLEQGRQGEIVVKGDNVMLGYYRNEEATREVLRNGWLYTGDLGFFDPDGFLYVLGRTKSLLIGDDGEKYSPEGIEEYLEEHANLVRQIMIYNNQNPYTTALVFPDRENLLSRIGKHGEEGPDIDSLRDLIREIAKELNHLRDHHLGSDFPSRWFPSTFILIPEGFTTENQMLNSTLKIVRRIITDHFHEEILFLYSQEGKNPINERNIASLKILLSS